MAAPIGRHFERRGWDDARLVEASREGDQAAWATLYARHLDYTRAVAARRTADRTIAEDAVAVGWARAFERVGTLRDPSKFRPWVSAAVRHAALDEVRRNQRFVHSEDLTTLADDDDPVADAGVAAADRASRAIVARRAFLALPERHRKVLGMALVEDKSAKQIAAALALDPNAVNQLLHRAKNGLRRSYVNARLPVSTPQQCRRAHELTIDYVRGDESVREEIATHLAGCDFCAARLTEAVETRGAAWALFGASPVALIAMGSLSKKTLSALRAAFGTGVDWLQSSAQGVTSLPTPIAGGIAGSSVAVATAVVTVSIGVVPLPGGQTDRPPAASAAPQTAGSGLGSIPPLEGSGSNVGVASGGHTEGGPGAFQGSSSPTHPTSSVFALVTTTSAAARATTTTSSTVSTSTTSLTTIVTSTLPVSTTATSVTAAPTSPPIASPTSTPATTTDASTTAVPATTTSAPTTDAPTTEAPTTDAPTTAAPPPTTAPVPVPVPVTTVTATTWTPPATSMRVHPSHHHGFGNSGGDQGAQGDQGKGGGGD
jgi:RNA polymerase sigma factor (sigma-70 family)